MFRLSLGAVDHPRVVPHLDRRVTDPGDYLLRSGTRNAAFGSVEHLDTDDFAIFTHEATTVSRHGLCPFSRRMRMIRAELL
jgi:hypothetical protein